MFQILEIDNAELFTALREYKICDLLRPKINVKYPSLDPTLIDSILLDLKKIVELTIINTAEAVSSGRNMGIVFRIDDTGRCQVPQKMYWVGENSI